MRWHLGISLLFPLFCALPSHARSNISLETDREITISYASPDWNTSSDKIDTVPVVFRDANTGRMVVIRLEETEPDSGKFVGRFSITWTETDHVSPEIYIPSKDLQTKGQKQLLEMVAKGKIARRPIVVKKADNDSKAIDVFSSREEAEAAWKAYQEEQKLKMSKNIKPIPSSQNLEAEEQAEYEKKVRELQKAAAAHETDREKAERLERERMKRNLDAFNRLSETERIQHRANAKKLFDEGMTAYQAGDYVKSESKFREALDMDPTQTSWYFNYGVALYRNAKLNEAVVAMRIAPDDPQTATQKKYYMALIHLKLQELDPAQNLFEEVGKSSDPVLGPSGLFYEGVLLFSAGKFEESKKPFEDVIDKSQDPKLDEQAEDYLQRIANAIALKKLQNNKWSLTGTVGMMYDSNVLFAPNNQSSQGSVTNTGDVRLLTMGTLEYRPLYTNTQELAIRGNMSLTNSSNANVSQADAWVYSLEVPYTYKTVVWDKGYSFTVRPGYQMLYMSLTSSSPKRDIMNSPYVAFDNTFVMRDNWYSNYTFQYEYDGSQLHLGDPGYPVLADDANENQFYLKTAQTFLLDNTKKEALILTGGALLNKATGTDQCFDRLELGVTYARPIGTYAWNVGVTYYYLTYPIAPAGDMNGGREDNNFTFSTGVSKPVNDWFTWGVNGFYSDNSSSLSSTYQYNKFVIMTTATFNTGW